VLLKKGNLAKKNWQDNKKCCFYNQDESMQQLFIKCLLAKLVLNIVHIAFNLIPPKRITHIFGNLLAGFAKNDKIHI
jgi:hypothetical protein